MQYLDIWQIQDEITSGVNSLGFSLWNRQYDQAAVSCHVELSEQLPDDTISSFCSQRPLPTDYDGEGGQGSLFTMYPYKGK